MGNGVKRQGVCVGEAKKEVENGYFGRMHEGCAPPPLGGGRRQGEGEGEERAWEAGASIKGKECLSDNYGPGLGFDCAWFLCDNQTSSATFAL